MTLLNQPGDPVSVEKPGLEISRVRNSIQFRFNPVRQATAARLSTELDAFYVGRLSIGRFWEAMQNRDTDIKTASGKRGDSVENLEWQIVKDDSSDESQEALAEAQQKTLQAFYSKLSVTDILKQDTYGGVGLLSRQMVDARAKGWAVHEIIWKPGQADGVLGCELRFCPVYWFENSTGKLRFLLQDWAYDGVEMRPGEWIVTACDNYMESVTAIWLYKKELLQAWVRFCSKFGMPLPVIKTDAPKDSPEWDAAVEAATNISEDWGLVINTAASLEFAQMDRSGDGTFKSLYEDLKRTLVTVILGSDLATISAGSGSGQGASLQGNEDAKRERADACLISETLNRTLDKYVIAYTYGPEAPVLAKFMLVPSKRQDITSDLAVDNFFVANKVEISKDDLRERYGRSEPKDGQDIVGTAEGMDPGEQDTQDDASNPEDQNEPEYGETLANDAISKAETAMAKARANDLLSVARELSMVMAIENPEEMLKALRHYQLNNTERAKSLLSNPSRLAPEIEKLLASSVIKGISLTPEV